MDSRCASSLSSQREAAITHRSYSSTSPTPTTLQFGTPPCCYCRQATLLSLSVPLTRACLSTNTRTATSSSTPSCQVWPRCYRPACSVTQCKPSSTFVAIDWCIGRMRCSPCSPRQEKLRIPWRWRLAGAENLGQWLLAIRQQLQVGQPVDLRTAPAEVRWVQLNAGTEVQQRLVAARTESPNARGSVLIIGDSINVQGRHQLTSQTPGAMAVEAVDLRDLVNFARNFNLQGANALAQLAEFASSVMTGVGAANLRTRVESLRTGRARTPPTPAEAEAVAFVGEPTPQRALLVLNALAEQPGARVYRPEVLHCCRSAMQAVAGGTADFLSAAIQARERNRHLARSIARRSVGSTLLLKGLEADVSVVLHPELMTAQNLYVALTRGARHVVVCSSNPILMPVNNG